MHVPQNRQNAWRLRQKGPGKPLISLYYQRRRVPDSAHWRHRLCRLCLRRLPRLLRLTPSTLKEAQCRCPSVMARIRTLTRFNSACNISWMIYKHSSSDNSSSCGNSKRGLYSISASSKTTRLREIGRLSHPLHAQHHRWRNVGRKHRWRRTL